MEGLAQVRGSILLRDLCVSIFATGECYRGMHSDTQDMPAHAVRRRTTSIGFWLSVISAVAVLCALLHAWPVQIGAICVILGILFSQDWNSRGESTGSRDARVGIFRSGVVNFMVGAAAGCIIAGIGFVAAYCYGWLLPFSWTSLLQLSAGLGAAITSLFPTAASYVRAVFFFISISVTLAP